jgi:S1-C subfamily serine protease
MKPLKFAIAILFSLGRLMAVELGDTRESVIAEMGPPIGTMVGAGLEILRYSDVRIKLRDGRVVGVEKVAVPSPVPTKPPAPPAGTAKDQAKPAGPVTVPDFPKRFVGIPEFHTRRGTQSAGTAFLARRPNDPQVYILTVHHLLGPDGGFAELIPHDQVPTFVLGIRIDELFGQPTWHDVAGCNVPPGGDPDGPLADLAAFKISGVADNQAPVLAVALPAIGDNVWVIAHVRGGVPEGMFIHHARVTEVGGQWLVCEFENPQIVTNGASGAPVINAGGQIVGIYRGHADENGRKYAFIIPSPLILKALQGL